MWLMLGNLLICYFFFNSFCFMLCRDFILRDRLNGLFCICFFLCWMLKHRIKSVDQIINLLYFIILRSLYLLSFLSLLSLKVLQCSVTKVLPIRALHMNMLNMIKSKLMIFVVFNVISLYLVVNESISVCRLPKERRRVHLSELRVNLEVLNPLWVYLLYQLIMLLFFLHDVLWFYAQGKVGSPGKVRPLFFVRKGFRLPSDQLLMLCEIFLVNSLNSLRKSVSHKLFLLF